MITHARLLWPTVFRTVPGFFQSRPFHSDILRLTHGSSFSTNYFVLGTQKEMPPQLGTLDRSRPPVFALQSVRCYRVKKDTNMTSEEEFICKITKVAPSDTNTLQEFQRRLKYLVDKGCKPYELVEYPDILRLTESDIDRRIELLNSCGQSGISMPLLKFAKPETSVTALRSSLRRYLKQQSGQLNRVEEIRIALQCSDDEMMDILTRNPRLLGRRKRKFIVEKINCLLKFGATIEDIRSNTNLLNNKTLEDVESRARRLFELGYNDPLPIGVIGRDDADFEVVVTRLVKLRRFHPTSRYLESREIIAKIPEHASRKLHVVKPKVDYLLSRGYDGEEIIEFPLILELSLEAIHDAVTYLQSYHLGAVSLETCHKYATKKRVTSRQSSSRKKFAKALGCQSTELPPIPKDFGAVFNTEATLNANYDFLRSIGFTCADLKRLPIVLAHSTEVLRLHWDLIQTEEGLVRHFESWKDDKAKLLQLLQYSIEKESNFCRMAAATDVGNERKRAEDWEAETVDYKARDELTELEQETRRSFESARLDATGGPRVERDSAEMVQTDEERDHGLEHTGVEFDQSREMVQTDEERDHGLEHTGVEFDQSREMVERDEERDHGLEHTGVKFDQSREMVQRDEERDHGLEHTGVKFDQSREMAQRDEVRDHGLEHTGMEFDQSREMVQRDEERDHGLEHTGVEFDQSRESGIDVELGLGMEHDTGLKCRQGVKDDTAVDGVELDSGDMHYAGVELDSPVEHSFYGEFDPVVEPVPHAKPDQLPLGAEYNPDMELKPCVKHDLDADSGAKHDPSTEQDGVVENKQDRSSFYSLLKTFLFART